MDRGFSVSQPTFDSPLQFCPALGTQELDDLINAYVPGSASLQEKRTFVSMDFFNYSHSTGESFRYYSVPAMAASSSAESSPAQDSGYSSSFVSPALSNWNWPQAVSTAAPSKKSPVSRPSPPDFSNLPGMKIMTKDGRDVTNSASRGCKTKEQRDHAHLMRIIKACDACKKKKIRCDPSHKKRSSGATPAAPAPAQSTSRAKTAAARKAKQATPPQAHQAPSPPHSFPAVDVASFSLDPSLVDLDLDLLEMDVMAQDSWDSFVSYDETLSAVPDDYDFFFDPAGHFSPASSMSASPAGQFQPASAAGSFAHVQEYVSTTAAAPALPYMAAGAPGTDYVDFNLFSPTTSFIDDESMPVNDIGMVSAADSYGTVREPAPASNVPPRHVVEYAVPGSPGTGVGSGGQSAGDQQFVQRRDRIESRSALGGVAASRTDSPSMIGGVQNSGGEAVAHVHGLVHYAPSSPGRQTDVSSASPTLVRCSSTERERQSRMLTLSKGVTRGVSDDRQVDAAARPSRSSQASVERARFRQSSCGSSTVIATAERAVSNAVNQSIAAVAAVPSTAAVAATSATAVAAAAGDRTPAANVAVCAPRVVNSGTASGLGITSPVSVSPTTTLISRVSGLGAGVPGAESAELWRGLQQKSSSPQPVHSVSALVALGVLASGMPVNQALWLVQVALGLAVVASVLFSPMSPKTASKLASFSEQRICGTTPPPSSSDQDEKHGPLLTTAWQLCPGGEGRPSAHHQPCRQMDHARLLMNSAGGRLAASSGLSRALTQWNI